MKRSNGSKNFQKYFLYVSTSLLESRIAFRFIELVTSYLQFFYLIIFTTPNCVFCELYADSATRMLPLLFYCSFILFDCFDKILTRVKYLSVESRNTQKQKF